MPFDDMLYLDMRTKDRSLRASAFSDSIYDLVNDCAMCIYMHEITKSELWYADIYDSEDVLQCSFNINGEGVLMLNPASDKEKQLTKLGKKLRLLKKRFMRG